MLSQQKPYQGVPGDQADTQPRSGLRLLAAAIRLTAATATTHSARTQPQSHLSHPKPGNDLRLKAGVLSADAQTIHRSDTQVGTTHTLPCQTSPRSRMNYDGTPFGLAGQCKSAQYATNLEQAGCNWASSRPINTQ